MDALYKDLTDFLDDASRAVTFKYVQVEESLVRAWFPSRWWLAVYEEEFKPGESEEDKKAQKDALDNLVEKLTEAGFKRIRIRPSPIIKGL